VEQAAGDEAVPPTDAELAEVASIASDIKSWVKQAPSTASQSGKSRTSRRVEGSRKAHVSNSLHISEADMFETKSIASSKGMRSSRAKEHSLNALTKKALVEPANKKEDKLLFDK
jgi:hypothetical protein